MRLFGWPPLNRALAGALLAVLCSLLIGILSAWVYSPWLASIRGPALAGAALLGVVAVAGSSLAWWHDRTGWKLAIVVLATAGPLLLALQATPETRQRRAVLAMPADDLRRVGRHVIVGYHAPQDVEELIRRGAVGGLFVTARNARGKSTDALAAELASFQALARRHGHPPLILTTDQEGGFVSRLSPPLARPPLLATAIKAASTPDEQQRIARAEGERVGADLARVGITLNLAPLADLDFGIRNPADRMSRIGERAIGRDPAQVARIAKAYCDGLAQAGVACTLKHFPGLGRVAEDTHVASARLTVPRADLERQDWQPFRKTERATSAAVMIGHVVADAVDAMHPASISAAVVTGVLRRDLDFDGIVITDDLCMAAISDRRDGIAVGAAAALDAGVDLVLVSYDPAQVYAALAGLLRAGDDARRAASRKRLDAVVARPTPAP